MWIDRLLASAEGRPRLEEALDELWPYALGVLDDELRPELVSRVEKSWAGRCRMSSPCLAAATRPSSPSCTTR